MVIALSAVYTLPYGVGRGNGAEWKADKAQHPLSGVLIFLYINLYEVGRGNAAEWKTDKAQHPLSGVFLVYKLCDALLRVTVSDVHLTVNASLRYRF